MVHPAVKEKILKDLDRLPLELQRRAMDFVHGLAASTQLPPGATAEELMSLAGTLDPDSAREMREAIEEGCEQIDLDAWQ